MGSYKNNPNCKLNLTLDILYNFEMRTGNLMSKRIMRITDYIFTGLFKGQLYYKNIFSTVS